MHKFIKKIVNQLKSTRKTSGRGANNQTIKKEQTRNIILLVCGVVGFIMFIVLIKNHQAASEDNIPVEKPQTIDLASPLHHVDEHSVWVERAENQMQEANKATKNLQDASKKAQAGIVQEEQQYQKQQEQIKDLMTTVKDLQGQLATQKQAQEHMRTSGRMVGPANASDADGGMYLDGIQMSDEHLQLTQKKMKRAKKEKKTPDTYVSAGSSAKAVVLQGVDASAAVSAQSDPRPVLLRLLNNGTIPGGYHSHLKNCRLIGSGYGDASSERVYVRLETLSCTRHGVEHDFPVYGYLSGTDAKTGQHGPIVFRDGPFVGRAFFGGLMAGVGNIGQQYAQNITTTGAGQVSTVDPSKLPYAVIGSGFGTAGQMYAQYNIRRAEQYQPVVEFSAGNIVNVVFTKGFWLDGHQPSKNIAQDVNDIQSQASQNFSAQMNRLAQQQDQGDSE